MSISEAKNEATKRKLLHFSKQEEKSRRTMSMTEMRILRWMSGIMLKIG